MVTLLDIRSQLLGIASHARFSPVTQQSWALQALRCKRAYISSCKPTYKPTVKLPRSNTQMAVKHMPLPWCGACRVAFPSKAWRTGVESL